MVQHKVTRQYAWLNQLFIYGSFVFLSGLATFGLTFSQVNLSMTNAVSFLRVQGRSFWFTWLVTFLLFAALYALTNRYYVAVGIGVAFFMIYIVANYLKVKYRNEPILPSDIGMLTNIRDLVGMVPGRVLLFGGGGLVVLAGCVFLAERFLKFPSHDHNPLWVRIPIFLMLVLVLLPFNNSNHKNTLSNQLVGKLHLYKNASSISGAAQYNGPLLQFLSNVDLYVMDKPQGYSKQAVQAIVKKYQSDASAINETRSVNVKKDQTVIYILSESFANPNRLPFVKLNKNPAPQIDKIEATNPSGRMMSSGYGGGTANMEYMALTSFGISNFASALSTPYTQLVTQRSSSFSINQLFDQSIAIHPYDGSLYSRTKVFQKFKFQKFENMNNDKSLNITKIAGQPYAADSSSYSDALQAVNANKSGKSQFVQLTTMQNHMPYIAKYPQGGEIASSKSLSGSTLSQVDNYADGVTYTDAVTAKFLASLDKINKPITVLFYGDHLPGIYPTNLMNKYGVLLHQSDYFIYSNKAAQAQAAPVTNTKLTAPNYFSAMMWERMDAQVTPYLAMMTEIQQNLPAMSAPTNVNQDVNTVNLGNQWTDEDDQIVNESTMSPEQKQLIKDYRMIQYDQTAGQDFAKQLAFYK
ncbi:LTA synthase family protein [Schleiferilactobacillus perolens]|uniref:LTA synthase family protein n=1 Tax=Schleiferilactobacillus perolens TaxID=100468 RepID=UPI0039ED6631